MQFVKENKENLSYKVFILLIKECKIRNFMINSITLYKLNE